MAKSYAAWKARAQQLGWAADQYSLAAYKGTPHFRQGGDIGETASSGYTGKAGAGGMPPTKPYGPGPQGSAGISDSVYADYLGAYPDLAEDYKQWEAKGVTPAEYGAMHYWEHGKREGRGLGGTVKKKSSFASTEPVTSTATETATTDVVTDATTASTTSPDFTDPTSTVFVDVKTEPFDMAALTDEMDLTNKLEEVINMNSPLFQAASTKALQQMQKRGIVNSSLAQESVMNAILDVALPIATAEVQSLQNNLYFNTQMTNEQKAQANKYAYDRMLTKLQGALNYKLELMAQSFGAWGKYGDWIMQIATAPGAKDDDWKRMLDLIKGGGGWPQLGNV